MIAVAAGAYGLGTHAARPKLQDPPPSPAQTASRGWKALEPQADGAAGDQAGEVHPVPGPGPVPLQPLQAGNCRTFAPQGRRITDQNRDGTVFTLASPDGRLLASYAGAAIGSGQVGGYYGQQFRTPETFAL